MPTTTTANPPSLPNTHALPGRYYPLFVLLPRAALVPALGPLCKLQQEKHREALSLVWDYCLRTPKPTRFHSLVHFCLSLLSLYLPAYLPPTTTPPPPLLVNDFASYPFLHKLPSRKDGKANSHARTYVQNPDSFFIALFCICCLLLLLLPAFLFYCILPAASSSYLSHFRASLLGWRISCVEYALVLPFLQPHFISHTLHLFFDVEIYTGISFRPWAWLEVCVKAHMPSSSRLQFAPRRW
ncbi:uncharacterized protein BDZ83DRAFT_271055 [Colletotrichum acutatum]|uniref:Uncharacterized protein n=1 Tax=Glomerella acutata TaxID=27357 RepID=A0AAD8URY6_GLOAC|nr:uncharacterized protein BDZ83DRAFT_271055 [Colletotrichum acutatum]KAK1726069.1 hypothetical protein BDZ83DRAFT_271055 [Colletotrichum acutatum]